jgi:hypothetical protein
MKHSLTMLIRLLFVAYITTLYALILPAHGHEDLLEHADCVLCQLSNQAATVAAEFVLLIVSVILPVIPAAGECRI